MAHCCAPLSILVYQENLYLNRKIFYRIWNNSSDHVQYFSVMSSACTAVSLAAVNIEILVFIIGIAKIKLYFMRQQISSSLLNNIVMCMSDYRRDLDWRLDLLTTFKLMTALYKSLTHTVYSVYCILH
jgi:hypothetical protein